VPFFGPPCLEKDGILELGSSNVAECVVVSLGLSFIERLSFSVSYR